MNQPQKVSRVERRKLDSRARILRAAESLMRERSIDGVTIQDITEAADVGHGSFYLHFKSKYEVLLPLIQASAEALDDRLTEIRQDIEDPAEFIAVSARHMGRMITADTLWRWTLQHTSVPLQQVQQAIGRFSLRDFEEGFRSGRLMANESLTGFVGGGFVNVLMTALDCENAPQQIDNGVEIMLRAFGLSLEEAATIAHRPLPALA